MGKRNKSDIKNKQVRTKMYLQLKKEKLKVYSTTLSNNYRN